MTPTTQSPSRAMQSSHATSRAQPCSPVGVRPGPRLWRIALQPGESNLPSIPNDAKQDTLAAYSAYNLPSVADLIRYFLTVAGYPVRSTWLKAIGAGNYSSWTGLTLTNATKYCPYSKATIMGHLAQKLQVVRSTNPKPQPPSSPEEPLP